jgi:hypothetical protein
LSIGFHDFARRNFGCNHNLHEGTPPSFFHSPESLDFNTWATTWTAELQGEATPRHFQVAADGTISLYRTDDYAQVPLAARVDPGRTINGLQQLLPHKRGNLIFISLLK